MCMSSGGGSSAPAQAYDEKGNIATGFDAYKLNQKRRMNSILGVGQENTLLGTAESDGTGDAGDGSTGGSPGSSGAGGGSAGAF